MSRLELAFYSGFRAGRKDRAVRGLEVFPYLDTTLEWLSRETVMVIEDDIARKLDLDDKATCQASYAVGGVIAGFDLDHDNITPEKIRGIARDMVQA